MIYAAPYCLLSSKEHLWGMSFWETTLVYLILGKWLGNGVWQNPSKKKKTVVIGCQHLLVSQISSWIVLNGHLLRSREVHSWQFYV